MWFYAGDLLQRKTNDNITYLVANCILNQTTKNTSIHNSQDCMHVALLCNNCDRPSRNVSVNCCLFLDKYYIADSIKV